MEIFHTPPDRHGLVRARAVRTYLLLGFGLGLGLAPRFIVAALSLACPLLIRLGLGLNRFGLWHLLLHLHLHLPHLSQGSYRLALLASW